MLLTIRESHLGRPNVLWLIAVPDTTDRQGKADRDLTLQHSLHYKTMVLLFIYIRT
jgi:hypothetical protein